MDKLIIYLAIHSLIHWLVHSNVYLLIIYLFTYLLTCLFLNFNTQGRQIHRAKMYFTRKITSGMVAYLFKCLFSYLHIYLFDF